MRNFNSQIHVWFPLHLLVCRVHRLWSFLATFWSGFRTHYFQSVPIGSLHGARPLGYLLDGCPVEAGFWTWGSCLKSISSISSLKRLQPFETCQSLFTLIIFHAQRHWNWANLTVCGDQQMPTPLCIAIFVPKIALPDILSSKNALVPQVVLFFFSYNYQAFSWPFWQRISCGVCKEEDQ